MPGYVSIADSTVDPPVPYNSANPFPVTVGGSGGTASQVQGNVASGAADSGNPVKIGGVYSSVFTQLTTGQRSDARQDRYGQLRVSMVAETVAGTDAVPNSSLLSVTPSNTTGGALGLLSIAPYSFNGTSLDRNRTITGAIADGTGLGVAAVEQAGALFANIATATTVNAQKSGKGILHKVIINTYVASATITLYDSLTATGTKIGTITLPSTITSDAPVSLVYDLQFSTGLTIVTSGATDITVIYR